MENCPAPALASFTLAFHVNVIRPGPNLYSPLECQSWFQDAFPSLVELHLTSMILPLEDLVVPMLSIFDISAAHPLYTHQADGLYQFLAHAPRLSTLIIHKVNFHGLPSDLPLLLCPNVSTLYLGFRNDFHAAEIFHTLSLPSLTRFSLRLWDQSDIFALELLPARFFSGITHLTVVNPRMRGYTSRSWDFNASGLFSMFSGLRSLISARQAESFNLAQTLCYELVYPIIMSFLSIPFEGSAIVDKRAYIRFLSRRYIVGAICHSWRLALHCTPQCWTYILIQDPLCADALAFWISKATTLPLTVRLRIPDPFVDFDSILSILGGVMQQCVSFNFCIHLSMQDALRKFLRTIPPTCAWFLSLTFSQPSQKRTSTDFIALETALPALTFL
ncbi:hypothetical protein B0H16DRAFT_1721744 [Mycena metata]|uniref:Uncharacterized protein n=1 Tax=Mycena metata TaxID=1033252 RepID=A0AAD7J6H6_9AGAR|nr:hypothetical protein B0H16DRAFT_1721744 [Mycena metata]